MSTKTATKQQQTSVIYARVSSEEQVQGYSIQAQLRHAAIGRKSTGTKLPRSILRKAFQLIIVRKLDRLFRDSLESSTTRAILK